VRPAQPDVPATALVPVKPIVVDAPGEPIDVEPMTPREVTHAAIDQYALGLLQGVLDAGQGFLDDL